MSKSIGSYLDHYDFNDIINDSRNLESVGVYDQSFLQEIISNNFVIYPEDKSIVLDELLSSKWDFFLLGKPVQKVFRRIDLLEYLLAHQGGAVKLNILNCDVAFSKVEAGKELEISFAESLNSDVGVIMNEDDEIVGLIDSFRRYQKMLIRSKRRLWQKDLQIAFFRQIFDVMEDDVFITDEYGFIQYINPRGEEVCKIKLKDYIGRHVTDLEKDGVVSKSITMEVLRKGERVEEAVKLSSGRLIMAIGMPICDTTGNIKYVFSTSKDVKEINELLEKIAGMVQELDLKKRELDILRERMASQKGYIFESQAMKHVQKVVTKVAPTDVTILIEGQSGTGKEVVADLVYQCSNRHKQPFVKINCGLIPPDLLESELFGYEAGAFTGADKRGKVGKIEVANGGTVFFDEIGELPLPLQVKLLEFLQDRTITRVGGTKQIPIDTRVIAATNRELKDMVAEGGFRGDLYYRLNVMPIHLVPLSERREDILPLANLFLKKFNTAYNSQKRMDTAVLDEFYAYGWPGNVRELMHVVERLVITAENDAIDIPALQDVLNAEMGMVGNVICTGIIPLRQARTELENLLVRGAYEKYGSTYRAAEALGVNQSTVARILKKLEKDDALVHNY